MENIFLGIFIGIASSLIFWFFITHILTPSIEFWPYISKIAGRGDNSSFVYRIKFRNSGTRSIWDLDVHAEIIMHGLRPGFTSNTAAIHVPLRKNKDQLLPAAKTEVSGDLIVMLINKIEDGLLLETFPDYKERAKNGELALESLLAMNPQNYIWILIFGYDSFSGSRRLFLSKKYYLRDILEKKFDDSLPFSTLASSTRKALALLDKAKPTLRRRSDIV